MVFRSFYSRLRPNDILSGAGALEALCLCEAPDPLTEPNCNDGLLSRKEFFSDPAYLPVALYSRAPDGWYKNSEGHREVRVPAPIVFALLSSHLFRDSCQFCSLCDVFWTVVVSEMSVFIIVAVLNTAFNEVCT